MEKENRRVKYTKNTISKVFYQLLSDKPIEKITVKEICELADINRGTFYRYYQDVFDLYEKSTNETINGIAEMVLGTLKDYTDDLDMIVLQILKEVKKNYEYYKFLVTSQQFTDNTLLDAWIKRFQPLSIEKWGVMFPQYSEQQLALMHEMICYGVMAVVQKWIMDDCREDEEKLVPFIIDFYLHGLEGKKK